MLGFGLLNHLFLLDAKNKECQSLSINFTPKMLQNQCSSMDMFPREFLKQEFLTSSHSQSVNDYLVIIWYNGFRITSQYACNTCTFDCQFTKDENKIPMYSNRFLLNSAIFYTNCIALTRSLTHMQIVFASNCHGNAT